MFGVLVLGVAKRLLRLQDGARPDRSKLLNLPEDCMKGGQPVTPGHAISYAVRTSIQGPSLLAVRSG